MPPTKKTATKKTQTPPNPKSVPKETTKSKLGPYDVELSFDMTLKDSSGEVVAVKGSVPISNATMPVFVPNSQQTLTEMVEQLVQKRFLLQARYFFNQLQKQQVQFHQPEVKQDEFSTNDLTDKTAPTLSLPDAEFGLEDEQENESS